MGRDQRGGEAKKQRGGGARAGGAQRRLPEAKLKTACDGSGERDGPPRTCGAGGYVGARGRMGVGEDGGEGEGERRVRAVGAGDSPMGGGGGGGRR